MNTFTIKVASEHEQVDLSAHNNEVIARYKNGGLEILAGKDKLEELNWKVGDWFEAIKNCDGSTTKGKKYKINKVEGRLLWFTTDDGPNRYFLVQSMFLWAKKINPFQPGSYVKYLGESCSAINKGQVVKIINTSEYYSDIFHFINNDGRIEGVRKCDIEPADSPSFKVGDTVMCVDPKDSIYISVGKKYTVESIKGNSIIVVSNDKLRFPYENFKFQLFPAPSFKVGQWVRAKETKHQVEAGKVYRIKYPCEEALTIYDNRFMQDPTNFEPAECPFKASKLVKFKDKNLPQFEMVITEVTDNGLRIAGDRKEYSFSLFEIA